MLLSNCNYTDTITTSDHFDCFTHCGFWTAFPWPPYEMKSAIERITMDGQAHGRMIERITASFCRLPVLLALLGPLIVDRSITLQRKQRMLQWWSSCYTGCWSATELLVSRFLSLWGWAYRRMEWGWGHSRGPHRPASVLSACACLLSSLTCTATAAG